MTRPAVLVTAVSGDVGMSTVRALHKHGYAIIGTDISPYCAAKDLLKRFYQVPTAASPDYLTAIRSIVRNDNISVALPISEAEITTFSAPAASPFPCAVAVHRREVIEIFLDKFKSMQWLSKHGLAVPTTSNLEVYDNSLPYPLIIKPRTGCGSSQVHVILDDFDLAYYQKKAGPNCIIQEYIGSPEEEYTTGVFCNETEISAITFKRKLVSGCSWEVETVMDPAMTETARAIGYALGTKGCLNIQTRKINGKHVIFEINPRISGTVMFRALAGFEDAHWWIRVLLGESISAYIPTHSFRIGLRFLGETTFQ